MGLELTVGAMLGLIYAKLAGLDEWWKVWCGILGFLLGYVIAEIVMAHL